MAVPQQKEINRRNIWSCDWNTSVPPKSGWVWSLVLVSGPSFPQGQWWWHQQLDATWKPGLNQALPNPGPVLVVVGIWKMNQLMETDCFSQINANEKLLNMLSSCNPECHLKVWLYVPNDLKARTQTDTYFLVALVTMKRWFVTQMSIKNEGINNTLYVWYNGFLLSI